MCGVILNLKTCEQCSPRERNDLRGEKFTAPINRTKTYFVNHSRTHAPALSCDRSAATARKLTDSGVDIRVHVHGLIRNYSKRLRCRTEAPRSMVLDIENVISRRERDAIIFIGVRCHPRGFLLLVTAQDGQWIIGVILRCHFKMPLHPQARPLWAK